MRKQQKKAKMKVILWLLHTLPVKSLGSVKFFNVFNACCEINCIINGIICFTLLNCLNASSGRLSYSEVLKGQKEMYETCMCCCIHLIKNTVKIVIFGDVR